MKRIIENPVTQFNLLLIGTLMVIQLVHIHAHHKMDVDVHSYVFNFCRNNPDQCKRMLSEY